jgi:hypothetical protein
MSLVGQEVDITDTEVDYGHDGDDYSCVRETSPPRLDALSPSTGESHGPLSDDNGPTVLPGAGIADAHPPVSPAGPAERLFLSGDMLYTDSISAAALAQQIHNSHRSFAQSMVSVVTDDFVTARDDIDSRSLSFDGLLTPFDLDNDNNHFEPADESETESPFHSDALALNLSYEPETTAPNSQETTFYEARAIMSSSASTSEMHIDAAEKVYDNAKGVWAWGKGIMVVSPFLGLAEGVAGKVASMAGSTLEEVDHQIVPHLHTFDDSVLNPALAAVVGTIMGAVSKSEEIFKPIVFAILKPIGLIKDDKSTSTKKKKKSEPELTTAAASLVK